MAGAGARAVGEGVIDRLEAAEEAAEEADGEEE